MKAFMHDQNWVLEKLNVVKEKGLTKNQVIESKKQYGENTFTKEKPDSLIKRIWDASTEPMILMLIFAGIITFCVNVVRYIKGGEADFIECVGIFAAISLSVIITVFMEKRSAESFEILSKIGEDTSIKVIRDGRVELIMQKDIVVGDIICLEIGDKIPADGRIIESIFLEADESSLTGESNPVDKNANDVFDDEKTPVAERSNMLYSGCFITNGTGKIVVTSVGNKTEFGQIAKELSKVEKSSTPLQEKFDKLGKNITLLGGSAALIIFIIQLVIFITNKTANFETVSDAFITSIILIVAAVPEGLPTIVAVSLAINIIKMSKENALVKKMIACETVGCINVVCSDKTGTLTQNRMSVVNIYSNNKLISSNEIDNNYLIENFCINSTANLNLENNKIKFIGNPTECALLLSAEESGYDYKRYRENSEIMYVCPFSSEKKMMSTFLKKAHKFIAYTKGSPEKIISVCNLTNDEKENIENQIQQFQEKSYRIIGFSHKIFDEMPSCCEEFIESDMMFDGFVAISDPLREDVFDSVNKCRDAGIDLKILTGDNIVTAKSIAKELNILKDDDKVVEARDIEGMTDEEFYKCVDNIKVIARCTPSIKMRVVNVLKSKGNVVAVTGDGINDAPAIKNADVGIAMGISGTEVSKEASDIVLLDDSFSTIVKAVQWGRGIYENFQRFIQFQLTVNLSSVIVVLASILAGFVSPFSALQLLWINIVMDGPPALTLGLEPIRKDLMKRKPIKRNSNIITKEMLYRIVFNGLFISLVFMIQHVNNFLGCTKEQEATVLFTLFVIFQLFNAFNCRELNGESVFKNMIENKLMLKVFTCTFLLQIVITQFGGNLFGTVPLEFNLWIKIIITSLSIILVSEIFKIVTLKLGIREF